MYLSAFCSRKTTLHSTVGMYIQYSTTLQRFYDDVISVDVSFIFTDSFLQVNSYMSQSVSQSVTLLKSLRRINNRKNLSCCSYLFYCCCDLSTTCLLR